jgi:hypothetical protein
MVNIQGHKSLKSSLKSMEDIFCKGKRMILYCHIWESYGEDNQKVFRYFGVWEVESLMKVKSQSLKS